MASVNAKWQRFLVQQRDNLLGRERIGVDRHGNKYYQYFSYHGLPTKRIVLYKFFDTNCIHQDPHFVGWLRRNEILPPTPEELERLYLEHDAFVQRGIEWDEEQRAIIEQFNDKKKELDEKYDRPESLPEPRSWIPGTKSSDVKVDPSAEAQDEDEQETGLTTYSNVDEMEKMYMEEFERVH